MLNIYCPHCGEHRSEEEFHYAGEAHIPRPENPAELSDEAWGDYLFFRRNPRGLHHEQWYHATGCRRFFNVARDTVTYEIHESYPMGARPSVSRDSEEAA
ncbi:sarcosine oxidase subunit delta [Aquisalimonas lutea]|uniref:sarcosine oxidase subunit delta n=1 Tax=Aquisalimonas lutea TaxID=1327750 RepID=UPI0025B5CC9A|nr:sarcosine oxidase subunit delta [Aquisalimonas lutea]MDN3519864.1 sarcosine oxidase subunit delta [Aquisalimonas lutea]